MFCRKAKIFKEEIKLHLTKFYAIVLYFVYF